MAEPGLVQSGLVVCAAPEGNDAGAEAILRKDHRLGGEGGRLQRVRIGDRGPQGGGLLPHRRTAFLPRFVLFLARGLPFAPLQLSLRAGESLRQSGDLLLHGAAFLPLELRHEPLELFVFRRYRHARQGDRRLVFRRKLRDTLLGGGLGRPSAAALGGVPRQALLKMLHAAGVQLLPPARIVRRPEGFPAVIFLLEPALPPGQRIGGGAGEIEFFAAGSVRPVDGGGQVFCDTVEVGGDRALASHFLPELRAARLPPLDVGAEVPVCHRAPEVIDRRPKAVLERFQGAVAGIGLRQGIGVRYRALSSP